MDYDENRSWMYNRVYENMGLRKTFVDGVGHFIDKAKLLPEYLRKGKIRCPCAKCKCSNMQRTDAVVRHLFRKGFVPNYFVWTAHGETQVNSSSSVTTGKRKVRKKHTSSTVPLPNGIGAMDLSDRLKIKPEGDGFVPSYKVVKIIKAAMKAHFKEGWPTWGKIPVRVRDAMFHQFTTKCVWEAEYDYLVRRNFEKKAAQRLSDGFSKYRKLGKVPGWIYPEPWKILKAYWDTPEFAAISEQAKKNRASEKGGSLHTCGSVSLATHRQRYEAEHGAVSDIEIYCMFRRCYDDDGNVIGWVKPRAQQVDENYQATYDQWVESQGSGVAVDSPKPTLEEEAAIFVEAAGGYTSKGRAYGLGPARYKQLSRIGIVNGSCSSSFAPQSVDPTLEDKFKEMEKRLAEKEIVEQRLVDRQKEIEQKLEAAEKERQADREKMLKLESLVSSWMGSQGHGVL